MAENLNYEGYGVCFDNNSPNCDVYGRMYTIFKLTEGQGGSTCNNVKGVCPQGWHVPSNEEVEELLNFVGGQDIASDMLKADTIWAGYGTVIWEDAKGFAALQAGRGRDEGQFNGIGTRCEIWTSKVTDDDGRTTTPILT